MKKFSMLIIPLFLFASIHWQTNFNKAYKLSKKSHKPLFMFIERKNPPCHWCHKMLSTTLANKKIADYINHHFIPLRVDRDNSNYPDELYPRYVPTIYIIEGDKVIKKIVGYWDVRDFWSDLEDINRYLNNEKNHQ